MAKCGNCGTETPRVRSKWNEDGQLPDECPHCALGSFEKFTAPSDKKPWMGWEAHPNEYEKRYDQEGLIYERKPEYRAESEAVIAQGATDEREAQLQAELRKRLTRRTQPMDEAETLAALNKGRMVAKFLEGNETDVIQ